MSVCFRFDIDKCSGCGACSVACMDQNDVDTERGQTPPLRVFSAESDKCITFFRRVCIHCEEAPCVKACPTGCLYKDEDTSLVLADRGKCIGCKKCVAVCPFGALTPESFDSEGKIQKCDGCIERIRAGLVPACVRACPYGALTLETEENA